MRKIKKTESFSAYKTMEVHMKEYKIQEVADILGVSYWTVKRWIYKDILKARRPKRPSGLCDKNAPYLIPGAEISRMRKELGK